MDDGPEARDYEGYALVCFACRAGEQERKKWMSSDDADMTGVKFMARPIGGGDDG